jgi:tetrapyrrole methylase family protein/MazG family protein
LEKTLNHTGPTFEDIINLIETLRGDNGCPWDKKQTPATMVRYLVEETFELMDAIQSDDEADICEELGDVLFLVLFVAVQYQAAGRFDMGTLVRRNLNKMVRRHPHVFGQETAKTPKKVRQQWRDIKRDEKANQPGSTILGSVPKSLPALMRAHRISERAASTGFDWDDIQGVMKTAEEEWAELKQEFDKAPDARGPSSLELEFGDVLFTLVNVARKAGFHSETALAAATRKFETRFNQMEKMAQDANTSFEELSFEEKHRLWDRVKQAEHKKQV